MASQGISTILENLKDALGDDQAALAEALGKPAQISEASARPAPDPTESLARAARTLIEAEARPAQGADLAGPGPALIQEPAAGAAVRIAEAIERAAAAMERIAQALEVKND